MHACVCLQKKKVVEEEEYFGLMGVFRCTVMKQISTGPCMPANVVYSRTLPESHNTPQSRGSMNPGKQRGERGEGEMEAETGEHTRRASAWSRLRRFLLSPPLSPPALKIQIHHSTVASQLLWSLSITLTALPTTIKAFAAGLKTQPHHTETTKSNN